MPQPKPQTVDEYLAQLPPSRLETIAALRQLILQHLPDGYQETILFGMINYVIPLETYPVTYNRQPLSYVALASQKNYISLYPMGIYSDDTSRRWFLDQYAASGKKLDLGKACLRFKTLDDLPLDLIAQAVARTSVADFIKLYEAARLQTRGARSRSRPKSSPEKAT